MGGGGGGGSGQILNYHKIKKETQEIKRNTIKVQRKKREKQPSRNTKLRSSLVSLDETILLASAS